MQRRRLRELLVVGLLLPIGLAGCGSSEKTATAKPPVDGFHYNGTTEQGLLMTFSVYGAALPLYELRFECDDTVAATSIEAVPIAKRDGRYTVELAANGLVGYADLEPDENGSIEIAGAFASDAKSATGTVHVKTDRCDSGVIEWTGDAEPERRDVTNGRITTRTHR